MDYTKKIILSVVNWFGTAFDKARLPDQQNQNLMTMKAKILFVLFLIGNRALLNYLRNLHEYSPNRREMLFKAFSPRSWIDVSFLFPDTPEGKDYWKNISEKWIEFANNINL